MRWRKLGDERWESINNTLLGEGDIEQVFIGNGTSNQYKCSECGKSLSRVPYVLYGPVPRTIATDQRYCVEHSPIAIEVEE